MKNRDCPGLCADWLLAWLAAVGTTVLDARLRLRWSTRDTPFAVLLSNEVDPIDAILGSWPSAELLADMPIAKAWRQTEHMERKVSVEAFRERAQLARGHPHSWALSSTMTDLQVGVDGMVAHGAFDPTAPGTAKGLHDRLMRLHQHAKDLSAARILDSLTGLGVRVEGNGLAFDHTRLGSLADKTGKWTDPVVEVLAFFGLAILPVRGNGVDQLGQRAAKARQRGWRRIRGSGETRHFAWPAWNQPLDRAGVDALLDVWDPARRCRWPPLGVQAGWRSVEYKPQGNERTVAYGSERL